jgi:hypothetical protein
MSACAGEREHLNHRLLLKPRCGDVRACEGFTLHVGPRIYVRSMVACSVFKATVNVNVCSVMDDHNWPLFLIRTLHQLLQQRRPCEHIFFSAFLFLSEVLLPL